MTHQRLASCAVSARPELPDLTLTGNPTATADIAASQKQIVLKYQDRLNAPYIEKSEGVSPPFLVSLVMPHSELDAGSDVCLAHLPELETYLKTCFTKTFRSLNT